jgi:hypothetical protein
MVIDTIEGYDIVPTSLAVMAMRDNGYKNAAYAVAELMDNSIQARASVVELLCCDQEVMIDQRARRRLNHVGVLDNGCGMDADTLQIALQFGNGSRLEEGKRSGMGRFGMGLPSASISQCQRVEVWSWQGGPDAALYSYIDLAEIQRDELRTVPAPRSSPVPELWRQAAADGTIGQTGTLVVWSKIDRSLWRTSLALINNSEELIGRIYRDWIHDGSVRIRLKSFMDDDPRTALADKDARPNDPMYLMSGTSCPAPFADRPMFQPFPSPDSYEITMTIRFQDADHTVKTRFSIATEEAREGDQAGARPHGRHAGRNVGVSVVRAGRELELDPGWTNTYDPRERWWGVEVRFEPGLDELFGVSNNKQSARNFAEAAKMDTHALVREHGGSMAAARAALRDEEDPIEPLLEVVNRIQTNIREMRRQISVQAEGRRRQRHRDASVEERATEAVRERQRAGHIGRSDADEQKPTDERTAELAEQLVHQGHTEDEAKTLAAETIDKGLKYRIEVGSLEGGAFFSVQPRGGVLLVTLNTDHPAYELLLGAQNPDDLPDDPDALIARLQAAQQGLEMMLFAWGRYEDEQSSPELRRQAQNIRYDWGRMAENFLESRAAG